MSQPYIVYGMQASYFTRKLLGLLAYKDIAVDFRPKTIAVRETVERNAGTHQVPVVHAPDGTWMTDTTPIALAIDRQFPGSDLLPGTGRPVLRMAARVLEDFFDEWTTRQAVHFRWHNGADTEFAGGSLARDVASLPQEGALDDQQRALTDTIATMIRTWGLGACERVGAAEANRAEMEGEFTAWMKLLDQHFAGSRFLLGDRPCLADFALYGANVAHFTNDPTPKAIVAQAAPNVMAFTDRLGATRAADGVSEWPADDTLPDTLVPVLDYVGGTFHRFLNANRRAIDMGEKTLVMDFGYGDNTLHVRRYTDRCRAEIAGEIDALPDDARARVEAALDPRGCWAAYR